jgi:hypothetical protein
MLNNLHDHKRPPAPPDNTELNRKLDRLEDLVAQVLEQTQPRAGPPPVEICPKCVKGTRCRRRMVTLHL